MKKTWLFAFLLCSFEVFAQTDTTSVDSLADDEKVYAMVDIQEPPEFPGGAAELEKFITETMVYPGEAADRKIAGIVTIKFVVNKDGSLTDIRIVRDIGGGCGQEARRIVQLMPRWRPGALHQKVVRVDYTLPVRFKLR